jgi:hypothetical protein
MLSKIELEFLKSPEHFSSDYSYVIKHRLKGKIRSLQEELALLGNAGFLTENSRNLTEFSKIYRINQGLNQAVFAERKWAEPDLNRRPLARKANVLTKLDDRPAHFAYLKLDLSCLD